LPRYTGLLNFTVASNGAKVGDWLGTAGTAAALSAHWAEKARAEGLEPSEQSYAIGTALEHARQALEELQIVRDATSA
jgi:hypothetical protein